MKTNLRWVGVVCSIVLMLAPLASNAMMNQDPGMCDIMCGGDQACYLNCLYGGGGGGGTGGGGGGGWLQCQICKAVCNATYALEMAACAGCTDFQTCTQCYGEAMNNRTGCIANCVCV